jgi:hypothetical protein
MHRAPALLLGLLVAIAVPVPGLAQAGSCQLVDNQYTERRSDGVFSTIFIQGPLLVRCTGGAEIRAEVGTLYELTREIHLSGNVSFRDPERRLISQNAVYSSVTGRLHATGDVVFTDLAEGMTLRGPELEYFRAMPDRPQSQTIAEQRPHLTLMPRPGSGDARPADSEPIEIDADRMTTIGNEQYTASGRVEIRRSDFEAFSREARVDQSEDRMELIGDARLVGEQFELRAERIDMLMPDDRLERLDAQDAAELVADDLRIDAPEVRLFFENDELQRMVARTGAAGAARAVATARAFRLEADSIDALVPNQRLEQVIAIGSARGESLDTTAVPSGRIERAAPAGSLTSAERDWILGDTITSFFVAVEPAEAADEEAPAREEVQLNRLLARGSAQSLYRVESTRNGAPQAQTGLNYLVGDMIELTFDEGQLSVAEVRGLKHGLYLEPNPVPAVESEEPSPPAADEPAPALLSRAGRTR